MDDLKGHDAIGGLRDSLLGSFLRGREKRVLGDSATGNPVVIDQAAVEGSGMP